jgi:hypothetical protein
MVIAQLLLALHFIFINEDIFQTTFFRPANRQIRCPVFYINITIHNIQYFKLRTIGAFVKGNF